jgi:hypothetical protein
MCSLIHEEERKNRFEKENIRQGFNLVSLDDRPERMLAL